MNRLVACLLCAVVLLSVGSPAASAHNGLSGSSPQADEQIATAPSVIELRFTEAVIDLGAAVIVTGPDGPVQVGTPTISGRTVQQALQPQVPAGDYTVNWRVVSQDGHPVSGTFTFHAAADREGSGPAPVAEAGSRPDALPGWGWLVLTLLALVTVGGLAAQRARQRR